jgi:hypothetical protein
MAEQKRVAARKAAARKPTAKKRAVKKTRTAVTRPRAKAKAAPPARKRRSRVEMALVRVARSLIELAEAMDRSHLEKTALPALARELTKALPEDKTASRG